MRHDCVTGRIPGYLRISSPGMFPEDLDVYHLHLFGQHRSSTLFGPGNPRLSRHSLAIPCGLYGQARRLASHCFFPAFLYSGGCRNAMDGVRLWALWWLCPALFTFSRGSWVCNGHFNDGLLYFTGPWSGHFTANRLASRCQTRALWGLGVAGSTVSFGYDTDWIAAIARLGKSQTYQKTTIELFHSIHW